MLKLLTELFTESIAVLKLVRALLWGLTVSPRGFGSRVQLAEESRQMAKVFTYRQGLLTPPAGVASQRLVVAVDGVSQEPVTVAADATSIDFKAGPEGATVVLSLDYLDAAGNDSANAEATFTVVDSIPPEAPVGFGEVTQIAEEEI